MIPNLLNNLMIITAIIKNLVTKLNFLVCIQIICLTKALFCPYYNIEKTQLAWEILLNNFNKMAMVYPRFLPNMCMESL